MTTVDVIDLLAGITPGSRLDRVRRQRAESRDNAQQSFDALFAPTHPTTLSSRERHAVAAFVAALHRDPVGDFYAARLRAIDEQVADAIAAEAQRGLGRGPYGLYREPELAGEGVDGPRFSVSDVGRATLGPRLSAALDHAHLLVFRPRESTPSALQVLVDAGWSPDDIVTLSQLVAFLTFQLRVVIGLRALDASPRPSAETSVRETSVPESSAPGSSVPQASLDQESINA